MRARTAAAWLACGLSLLMAGPWPFAHGAAPAARDWPMLAHDPARSGATTAEVRPPFERKWYRLFPDEGLMAGVQPIVADGKVFVGTLRGVVHAIDDATGEDAWTFQAPGAILHTCAAARGRVFFGCADGKVYALRASDGQLAWAVPTGAAIWNAPLVHQATVLIGSRDGKLYAIEAASGQVRWAVPTGGPLLSSPALDLKAGRVTIASEDMHVYAFALRDGQRLWRSAKLPGASCRGYHPVVAPDGAVMVGVTPVLSHDSISPILLDMVKEIFGDFASWRHTKEENARLRKRNFEQMAKPGTYDAQLATLRKRLSEQPACQSFFVLDPRTGRQRFVAPIVYGESMNATASPPIVTPDGKVIVKYRVLLRSRYQHYSPFMNVGYLDTASGHVTPIMDQSRTYGWHDSLLLVHDEQCQLVVAGRVLINTHQDNVNAMDLDSLKGYREPWCRNIHEPRPGEAIGIWAHLWRDRPVPTGKEWLARGTAVYGGGSVIDVPVSVAGDSFYYIPSHEINAGAAVIAYRAKAGGTASRLVPPLAAKLTDAEWRKVQQLPWDWDTLEMRRLHHVLKALPGKVVGTRQQPLSQRAAARVAKLTDAELDRFIWEVSERRLPQGGQVASLAARLARMVRELISRTWLALLFPAGKHPREAYWLFIEPTETLYTLARAYPYLGEGLQRQVRKHVAELSAPGCPLAGPTGRRVYRPSQGAVRSAYDHPPAKLIYARDDIVRAELARLYPLWLWAHATGEWAKLERHWPRLRSLVDRAPNPMEEDCRNGHLAGLIAYCRIAEHMEDKGAVEQGVAKARQAMRDRLAYELAHPRGGLITRVPVGRCIFARWRHLTPEVGRLLAAYARKTHRHLMDVYVDYHRPTWWLAWNVELMMRNECPFAFPTMSAEVFAARALILGEPAERLERFLDIPWCRADLFFIHKLVWCIEAHATATWHDLRKR